MDQDLDILISRVAETRMALQQAVDADRAASVVRGTAELRARDAYEELQKEIRNRINDITPLRQGDRIIS